MAYYHPLLQTRAQIYDRPHQNWCVVSLEEIGVHPGLTPSMVLSSRWHVSSKKTQTLKFQYILQANSSVVYSQLPPQVNREMYHLALYPSHSWLVIEVGRLIVDPHTCLLHRLRIPEILDQIFLLLWRHVLEGRVSPHRLLKLCKAQFLSLVTTYLRVSQYTYHSPMPYLHWVPLLSETL